MDEMITTEMDNLATNRGNNLLLKVLEFRYPHLVQKTQLKQLWQFLVQDCFVFGPHDFMAEKSREYSFNNFTQLYQSECSYKKEGNEIK